MNLNFEKSHLLNLRVQSIAVGFLYPIWYFLAKDTIGPEINDSIYIRIVIGAFATFYGISSFFSDKFVKKFESFYFLVCSAIIVRGHYLIVANDYHYLYVLGLFLVIFIGLMTFTKKNFFYAFATINMITPLIFEGIGESKFQNFVVLFSFTIIAFGHWGFLVKLKLIDNLKKSYEDLKRQQEFIANNERLATLGNLSSGIAHEINNPLLILDMSSKKILKHSKISNDDVLASQADKIINSVRRIANVINSLQIFSAEGGSEKSTLVSLENVLQKTMRVFSTKIKGTDIKFDLSFADKSLMIFGKENELSQVILGLLTNSFDAVSDVQDKWIKLEVFSTYKDIKITVSDSGAGIPEEIAGDILTPFFTTKKDKDGRTFGKGLGLSASKKIVEGHGGKMTLDKNGKFTRFIVSLPFEREAIA